MLENTHTLGGEGGNYVKKSKEQRAIAKEKWERENILDK